MPRPCLCDSSSCHLCHLYRTRADYRRLWDEGVTAAPQLGTAPVQPPARRPLECVHLGKVIRRAGCGTCRRDDVRRCEAGHGEVSQNGLCETCGDYRADD